ncbi:MAG: hypothetical protein QXX94_03345 [Candidatus Bathyarchaeia archaeon]
MKSIQKYFILIIAVIVVVPIVIYMLLPSQRIYLEFSSVNFIVETYGWRVSRVIELNLKNIGSENVTIIGVKLNGEKWNLWSPKSLLIPPNSVGKLKVFYPWNGGNYKITIETDKEERSIDVSAPEFNGVKVTIQNPSGEIWKNLVTFDFTFAPNELQEPKLSVYEDNNPIACQIWGVVKYEDGSVESASVSFITVIDPGEEKTYVIKLNEPPRMEVTNLNIERIDNRTIINNGVIKVRFNEDYRGEIDQVTDVDGKINYAKVFGIYKGSTHVWQHGFLQTSVNTYIVSYTGEKRAYQMSILTSDNYITYVESNGPFLATYARKWKLQSDFGWVYEFYAIPQNASLILYKTVFHVSGKWDVGPGPDPTGGWAYYNVYGTGYTGFPFLAIRHASFFSTESAEVYFPDWPGEDLWAKHSIAACVNATYGVAVTKVADDPVLPMEYWHITVRRWPFSIVSAPEPGARDEDVWTDYVAIAGIPEGKLCYEGQDLSREPYIRERSITLRGTITFDVGLYSWIYHIEIIVNRDIIGVLQEITRKYNGMRVLIERA